MAVNVLSQLSLRCCCYSFYLRFFSVAVLIPSIHANGRERARTPTRTTLQMHTHKQFHLTDHKRLIKTENPCMHVCARLTIDGPSSRYTDTHTRTNAAHMNTCSALAVVCRIETGLIALHLNTWSMERIIATTMMRNSEIVFENRRNEKNTHKCAISC